LALAPGVGQLVVGLEILRIKRGVERQRALLRVPGIGSGGRPLRRLQIQIQNVKLPEFPPECESQRAGSAVDGGR
jgi:hypothetical protein